MAKNHFSGVQNGSQSVKMGVLGGIFVLKSGFRILIRAPQVPFLVPPKKPGQNGSILVFLAILESVNKIEQLVGNRYVQR